MTRDEELVLFLPHNENFFGNSEQFRLRFLTLFFMATL